MNRMRRTAGLMIKALDTYMSHSRESLMTQIGNKITYEIPIYEDIIVKAVKVERNFLKIECIQSEIGLPDNQPKKEPAEDPIKLS